MYQLLHAPIVRIDIRKILEERNNLTMIRICLLILFCSHVAAFSTQPLPSARNLSEPGRRYYENIDISRGSSLASTSKDGGGDGVDDALKAKLAVRFDRWKFLQNILDGEEDADICDQVLYIVLDNAVKNPPKLVEEDEGDASAEMTIELKEKLEAFLARAENGRLAAVSNIDDTTWLDSMNSVLPDPVEDEDAYKSGWDVVIQLYGVEMTKISEKGATPEWKVYSSFVRLLMRFDFLERGVLGG